MGVNALFLIWSTTPAAGRRVRDAVIQAVSDGAVTAAAQVKAAMGLRKGAIDARFANLAADTALPARPRKARRSRRRWWRRRMT
jgi:hypothetical protein